MKTVSTKLLSLLLVAILLVSAIPFQAFAAEVDTNTDTDTVSDAAAGGDGANANAAAVDDDDAGGDDADAAAAQVTNNSVTHDSTHTGMVAVSNGNGTHTFKCTTAGCDYTGTTENCTNFNTSEHKCNDCGQVFEHNPVVIEDAKPATCTTYGITAKYKCPICGEETGGVIDETQKPTGHNFVNGTCTNCDATQEVKTVTLYPGDGHTFSDGSSSKTISIMVGADIPTFTTPNANGDTFTGWYIKDTGALLDTTKKYDGTWTELVAGWKTTSYEVTFYRILNNQLSTAALITKASLTPNTNLAQYVSSSGLLTSEKVTHPGYRLVMDSKDYPVKKYVNGVFVPLTNTDTAESLRTVYINLTPDTFTLSLNANGGSVTPSQITGIAYGTTIALPTPTKVKSVFQGWKDTDGNVYKGSMTYNFTSNATLTAVWDDEALVMLRIYTNGNFSAPDRIVELSGYVANSQVLRYEDVTGIVAKYYVSTSGVLDVRGLFKEADWASFQANTSLSGDPLVTIGQGSGINNIYVMVYNATAGQTVVSNNPTTNQAVTVPNNGNAYWVVTGTNTGYWVYTNGSVPQGAYWVSTSNGGYWAYNPNNIGTSSIIPSYIYTYIGTNPKTGDTAKIEIAAVVLVAAAAALVAVMLLRKKKKSE